MRSERRTKDNCLIVLAMSVFLGGCIDNAAIEEVGRLRPAETAQIADYIAEWPVSDAERIKDGVYTASQSKIWSFTSLTVDTTYIFEGESVSYVSHVHGTNLYVIPLNFSFSGKANFQASGGLLAFSDVVGDGMLFPLYPTPYEVVNEGRNIILHELRDDGSVTLLTLTESR